MAPVSDSVEIPAGGSGSNGHHHHNYLNNIHVHKQPPPDSPELAKRKLRATSSSSRGCASSALAAVEDHVPLDMQRRIDYFARLVVPFVIVIFNLYYWGSAIHAGGIEL